jgi:hypothetical protein
MTTRTLVEVSTDGLSTIEDSYVINNFTECLQVRNIELDAIRGFVTKENYTKVLTAFTKFQTQATRGMLSDEDDMIVSIPTLPNRYSPNIQGHIHYCFSIRTESKHSI